jgi:deazaflavin-dependent oxidoreductase (nitroreductase family)
LNHLANPFVKALLRSPLHGLLSERFLLITVTGATSGRRYTTPANYVRDGDTLTLLSRRNRRWWRNLRRQPGVRLRLRGEDVAATGRVAELSAGERTGVVRDFYQRVAGRALSDDDVARRADEAVVIRLELGR